MNLKRGSDGGARAVLPQAKKAPAKKVPAKKVAKKAPVRHAHSSPRKTNRQQTSETLL